MKKPPPARHITAYMHDERRVRKGVLPVLSGDIVIRRNEISTWSLTVNGNSTMGQRFQPGWRVSIWDTTPGLEPVQLIAGAATAIEDELSGGVRTVTISGTDDYIWLDQGIMLAAPELLFPENGTNTSATTGGYYVSGPNKIQPGGLILSLLDDQLVNAHQSHLQSRSGLMKVEYPEFGKDLGPTTMTGFTWGDLYKTLAESVDRVFAESGWDGTIDIRYVDETRITIFTTRSPTDLSRRVRLSMHNGGVKGFKITEEAPTVTQVYGIIPRLGESWPKTYPSFTSEVDDDIWGVGATAAIDVDDGGDDDGPSSWYAEGNVKERLEETAKELSGKTAKASIEVDVEDTPHLSFPRRFGLGDIITVDLEDAQFTDQVQRVDLSWGTDGVRANLQVGPELTESSTSLAPTIRDIKRKLRRTFVRG